MSSLYSITLHDVLIEWWDENEDARYVLTKAHNFTLIACRTCNVTWLRVFQDSKFEYATEPNGDQYYINPGDPDLFEKFITILDNVTHDPDYECSRD